MYNFILYEFRKWFPKLFSSLLKVQKVCCYLHTSKVSNFDHSPIPENPNQPEFLINETEIICKRQFREIECIDPDRSQINVKGKFLQEPFVG